MECNLDFMDQQQEHWDYEAGVASEYQNTFQNSKNNADLRDDQAAILTARRAGKFVAVLEVTVCCPHTDAIIGIRKICLGFADTKEAACAFLGEESQEEYVLGPDVA